MTSRLILRKRCVACTIADSCITRLLPPLQMAFSSVSHGLRPGIQVLPHMSMYFIFCCSRIMLTVSFCSSMLAAFSSSHDHASAGMHSPSREQPLFTFEQVGLICDRLMKEREHQIREEYDKVLSSKLAGESINRRLLPLCSKVTSLCRAIRHFRQVYV